MVILRQFNSNASLLSLSYLFLYLNTPLLFEEILGFNNGTAQPNLSAENLRRFFFPLPSFSEQQRIILKVDELIALCAELEAAEKEQDALDKHLAENLPKSILQAAVQGKLVSQNKDDEPASELLKRVQAEKATLIKAGKLKKEKPLSPIAEDEIPYDLPDGWIWCRLGELIIQAENDNIQSTKSPDTMIHYVDIDTIDNKEYRITEDKYLPVKQLSSRARRILTKGYILYSLVRPYLNNIAIVEEKKDNYIGSTGFAVFKPILVPVSYLKYLLLSPYITEYYEPLMSGFNSPSISQTNFINTPFPLPPLAEQQRIVAKVNELMSLCDELKRAYNQPISYNNVTSLPTVDENDVDEEPLQMAAQGKINAQPSPKHTDALQQLQGMMQDE